MHKNIVYAVKPDKVKDRLLYYAGLPEPSILPSTKMRGAITYFLNYVLGGDEYRYKVLKWLFGKTSSKDLLPQEWNALHKWIGSKPVNNPDGSTDWIPRETFFVEANWCLIVAIADEYQVTVEEIRKLAQQRAVKRGGLIAASVNDLGGEIVADIVNYERFVRQGILHE